MNAQAREVVPTPLAVDAAVWNDPATRTLAVRLSESAGGYQQSLWRESHLVLTRAYEGGWFGLTPTLYAATTRRRQVAHGLPGDFGQLLFHFPAGAGDSVYSELISKPGLFALVTMDRALRYFLGCTFRHRGDRV